MESKQGQRKNRAKGSKAKNDILIKIGIVCITLIFIFIIYKIFNIVVFENERINISEESYYQYFYGIYKEYSGDIEVINNDNSKQLVLENDEVIYLDSTPIYYKDTLGKVWLPNSMTVVYPETGKLYKTESFTNITQDSNVMYAKKHNKENTKSLNNVFLFDGEDLYFFLEKTIIKVGKKKYEISPLSYVIVNYRQNVEIYNYEKDQYIIIDETEIPSKDIIATDKEKKYEINLSVDTYNTGSSDYLLLKNIDYLNKLDY